MTAPQPTELPTLRAAIESALGVRIPIPFAQAAKNADKLLANLIGIPNVYLERIMRRAAGDIDRDEQLDNAINKALVKELPTASAAEVEAVAAGLIKDFIQRRAGRIKIAEYIAEELAAEPPSIDASNPLGDDFSAFYNGVVDSLGTDEARLLFAKVAAGEIKRPGSFSKPALTVLAEMDSTAAKLFERLCNISTHVSAQEHNGFVPRVYTIGMQDAGQNGLASFGLSFNELSILIELRLINPNLDTNTGLPVEFELAGEPMKLALVEKSRTPQEHSKAMEDARATINRQHPAILFTKPGRELRSIVSKTPDEGYIAKLNEGLGGMGMRLLRSNRSSI